MCAHISKRQLWIETDNRTQQKHHQDCKELVEMRAQIHFFKLSFTYQQKTTNDSVDYMRSRKRKQNKHNFYLTFQYIHVFSFMMWIQFILIIKTENLRNSLKKKQEKQRQNGSNGWIKRHRNSAVSRIWHCVLYASQRILLTTEKNGAYSSSLYSSTSFCLHFLNFNGNMKTSPSLLQLMWLLITYE